MKREMQLAKQERSWAASFFYWTKFLPKILF